MKRILTSLLLLLIFLSSHVSYAQNSEDELFLVAQKALEDGFYDVAQRYVNQFLQQYPHTTKKVEAKLLLGQCLFFKGQYFKAFETFQDLLTASTHQDAVQFWLAETHLKGKDYSKAKDGYQKIIDSYPSSSYTPQAAYALAWINLEQGQYDTAAVQFENFIKNFPSHQLAEDAQFRIGECEFNVGRYDNAIASFKKYISIFPKSIRLDQANFYIAEGIFHQQQYAEALKYYNLAKKEASSDQIQLLAQVGIAWCLFRLGDFSQAEKNMEDAKAFAETKKISAEESLLGLANLYAENKNYEKALSCFQRFLDEYPKSSRINECLLGQANALYMAERYLQAIESYSALIKNETTTSEIFNKAYLGLAWSHLKNNDLKNAISVLNEALTKTQSKVLKASILAQIADAYQDAGQFDDALENYDKILRDYPDTPYADYAQYQQGITLLKLEKPGSAILSFQSLEKNFPKSRYATESKYYLGVAYLNKGEWPAAQDVITGFIQQAPLDHDLQAEAHFILALCYQNLKQFDLAIKTLKKAENMSGRGETLLQKIKINIAKNFYEKGAIPEALQEFKLVIYKYPKTDASLEALLWLGEYYAQTLNIKNAISYYEQIVADYPDRAEAGEALWSIGQIYYKKEDYEQALNYFKKVKETHGPEVYAKAKLSVADTFARQLDPETAIQTYENIVKGSPEFARNAYIKIAEIQKENNQYAKALAAYRNTLNSKPKTRDPEVVHDCEIQFEIGDLCEILNKKDEAITEYLKIPYLYPAEIKWAIKAYLRTARIFEDKSDWESAKNIYQKIIGYNTDEKTFAQERLETINKTLATR